MQVQAFKSAVLSVVAVIVVFGLWWAGVIPGSAAETTIGVYNVRSGEPVVGVSLVAQDDDGQTVRLGSTNAKGQLEVVGVSARICSQATVASSDYVEVDSPCVAKPALSVNHSIFVDYNLPPSL